ncbi:hypothetical protein T484DRAFT_2227303 [Baffinella frigidus]|nr:hypothetical protein T484DRAFT_2227303 [Cryptophyta sp. CCMP2293]
MLGRGIGMSLVKSLARLGPRTLGPVSSGGVFPCVRRRTMAIWHPAQLLVERSTFSAQGCGFPIAAACSTAKLDTFQARWMSTGLSAEDFPLVELMKQVEVIKVRKELAEMTVQKIPVAEFVALCRRHGLSDAQAMRMLDAFHDSGVVLHFGTASSSKLRETVFIKPRDVLDTIWATLDLNGVTSTRELEAREKGLILLRGELDILAETKGKLDKLAEKEADRGIWIGGLLPLGMFSILFRMTYWEFSWDIVEPLSFFCSSMGPIVFFYFWFASHKEDFSLQGWRNGMKQRSQANLYRARAFDVDRYNDLLAAIQLCEEEIVALKKEL